MACAWAPYAGQRVVSNGNGIAHAVEQRRSTEHGQRPVQLGVAHNSHRAVVLGVVANHYRCVRAVERCAVQGLVKRCREVAQGAAIVLQGGVADVVGHLAGRAVLSFNLHAHVEAGALQHWFAIVFNRKQQVSLLEI